jgi:hypothetical protein
MYGEMETTGKQATMIYFNHFSAIIYKQLVLKVTCQFAETAGLQEKYQLTIDLMIEA